MRWLIEMLSCCPMYYFCTNHSPLIVLVVAVAVDGGGDAVVLLLRRRTPTAPRTALRSRPGPSPGMETHHQNDSSCQGTGSSPSISLHVERHIPLGPLVPSLVLLLVLLSVPLQPGAAAEQAYGRLRVSGAVRMKRDKCSSLGKATWRRPCPPPSRPWPFSCTHESSTAGCQ